MDFTCETHETAHGGHDPVYANEDPDRVIPVDVLRDMEKEGKIGIFIDISIQQLVMVQQLQALRSLVKILLRD